MLVSVSSARKCHYLITCLSKAVISRWLKSALHRVFFFIFKLWKFLKFHFPICYFLFFYFLYINNESWRNSSEIFDIAVFSYSCVSLRCQGWDELMPWRTQYAGVPSAAVQWSREDVVMTTKASIRWVFVWLFVSFSLWCIHTCEVAWKGSGGNTSMYLINDESKNQSRWYIHARISL